MKRAGLLLSVLLYVLSVSAQSLESLYHRLDSVLLQRSEYARLKESRIAGIRNRLHPTTEPDSLFGIYYELSEAYYTYRADSALYYADKALDEARLSHRLSDEYRATIHLSFLLSTTGYFSQALDLLNQIDKRTLPETLLVKYYEAYEWVYSVWSEYSGDGVFTPQFRQKEILYTDSLLQVLPGNSKEYFYWKAELMARSDRQDEAERYYRQALSGLQVDTRLYACVTCGIAFTYLRRGDMEQYERYLILAAISDMICPLKENLALQELSMHIFRTKPEHLERANRYLYYAMEDAMFYNNRLRMLEIAQKYPFIVKAYQDQNAQKSRRILWGLTFICFLSVGLMVSLFFIYRQMKQLRQRRAAEQEMNNRLSALNRELLATNRSREKYVSLFLDLCAAYIDKLNRYQELVRRKVKAKQTDDLLKLSNSTKMPESDAKQFFVNFDTAFLTLYPHFREEFNKLLREDGQIELKRGELLNTELRIFALVRMGVHDSSQIATLLFYSPQTIYNYRTSVRNRAIDRERFEEQVKALCPLVETVEPKEKEDEDKDK